VDKLHGARDLGADVRRRALVGGTALRHLALGSELVAHPHPAGGEGSCEGHGGGEKVVR
jgi:hypothetical protein